MPRALIVIDVQNEYFTGAFPITHPVGHLDNILKVMDVASGAKVPTVVVRHAQPDPKSPVFCKGSKEWELHPAVANRPRDALVDKHLPRLARLDDPNTFRLLAMGAAWRRVAWKD